MNHWVLQLNETAAMDTLTVRYHYTNGYYVTDMRGKDADTVIGCKQRT